MQVQNIKGQEKPREKLAMTNNLKILVSRYDDVMTEIEGLKQKHGITDLETKLEELNEQIKSVAREADQAELDKAQSTNFIVKVARPFKAIYSWSKIQKYGKAAEVNLIEDRALKTEIDAKEFEKLVKEGAVSRELKAKVFSEEAQTPRVTIARI